MARRKSSDGLVQVVRKDWNYYKGKRERRWRIVFEYLTSDGEKRSSTYFRLKDDADLALDRLKIEHNKKGASFSL